jgi:hypothetical protein
LVDFFNVFTPSDQFDELFYLASLNEFLNAPDFRKGFTLQSPLPAPEMGVFPAPIQQFIDFDLSLPPERLPPFQFASIYHESSIRVGWSLIVTDGEDVYSSLLPVGKDGEVEMELEMPVSATVLSTIIPPPLCQHFGPFQVRSRMTLSLTAEKVRLICDDAIVHHCLLYSSSLFVFLKIESPLGQLIKFRVLSTSSEKAESLPIVVDSALWSAFHYPVFPLGSLFTDSFQGGLADSIRNSFWKSIYLRILPSLQLDSAFLVRVVHALLCDAVPISEILRVDFVGITGPSIALCEILSKVNSVEFIDRFLNELDVWVRDNDKHRVWRDNTTAFPVGKMEVCRGCVVFGEADLVIATHAMESPCAGAALPMQQLARSGIELLRFVRNAVDVICALGQFEQLDRVREIVQNGVEMRSVVLCSPAVYTIDDFIAKLRK